ncbi:hypothetical protein Bca52824_032658 [Brassica carinata]|uniref:Uncharacterized protein n=1 Tax=Brassica carinata TaxID=52824 RepID=A0A8X7V6H9_BRACI|nr:hypothetical protein Bca52824_032658 [Brassica carinata]
MVRGYRVDRRFQGKGYKAKGIRKRQRWIRAGALKGGLVGSTGVDEVEGNRGRGRITGEEARASEEVEGEMEEEGTAVAAPVTFLEGTLGR